MLLLQQQLCLVSQANSSSENGRIITYRPTNQDRNLEKNNRTSISTFIDIQHITNAVRWNKDPYWRAVVSLVFFYFLSKKDPAHSMHPLFVVGFTFILLNLCWRILETLLFLPQWLSNKTKEFHTAVPSSIPGLICIGSSNPEWEIVQGSTNVWPLCTNMSIVLKIPQ